jgi:hypothetical protein
VTRTVVKTPDTHHRKVGVEESDSPSAAWRPEAPGTAKGMGAEALSGSRDLPQEGCSTCAAGAGAGSAQQEWNQRVRGESAAQQSDRHYVELLQEMRVAQTGVQILFAFLLSLAFTQRFEALDAVQRTVYVVALTLSAAAAGVLLAPVMYHRLVFRQRLKHHVVMTAHRLAITGLILVLLSLLGAVQLAVSLVLGFGASVLAALVGLALVVLWFGLPLLDLRRHDRDQA